MNSRKGRCAPDAPQPLVQCFRPTLQSGNSRVSIPVAVPFTRSSVLGVVDVTKRASSLILRSDGNPSAPEQDAIFSANEDPNGGKFDIDGVEVRQAQ